MNRPTVRASRLRPRSAGVTGLLLAAGCLSAGCAPVAETWANIDGTFAESESSSFELQPDSVAHYLLTAEYTGFAIALSSSTEGAMMVAADVRGDGPSPPEEVLSFVFDGETVDASTTEANSDSSRWWREYEKTTPAFGECEAGDACIESWELSLAWRPTEEVAQRSVQASFVLRVIAPNAPPEGWDESLKLQVLQIDPGTL